jgi:hypothetical protein
LLIFNLNVENSPGQDPNKHGESKTGPNEKAFDFIIHHFRIPKLDEANLSNYSVDVRFWLKAVMRLTPGRSAFGFVNPTSAYDPKRT